MHPKLCCCKCILRSCSSKTVGTLVFGRTTGGTGDWTAARDAAIGGDGSGGFSFGSAGIAGAGLGLAGKLALEDTPALGGWSLGTAGCGGKLAFGDCSNGSWLGCCRFRRLLLTYPYVTVHPKSPQHLQNLFVLSKNQTWTLQIYTAAKKIKPHTQSQWIKTFKTFPEEKNLTN